LEFDPDKNDQRVAVPHRWIGKKRNASPESVVEDIIPRESVIKNPFTSKNIFRTDNDPLSTKLPIPGAIAFGSIINEDRLISYGFCFQGQNSTTIEWDKDSTFYGRQNFLSLQGIEFCTIFAQYR